MERYTLAATERLLRMRQVEELCGIKRATIYGRISAGTFPPPVKLGARRSVWPLSQISQWIDQQIRST